MDTTVLFREAFLNQCAELFPNDPQARERLEAKLDAAERTEMADALLLAIIGVVDREGRL